MHHLGRCSLHAQLLQSCPTLCDPVDCSLPGSSVHEILPARILKWVAMPSSRGSSWPRDWTHISYFCIGRLKQQCYPIRWETNRGIYTSTPGHQELKPTPGHVTSHSGHWESRQGKFWKPEKKKSSVNK